MSDEITRQETFPSCAVQNTNYDALTTGLCLCVTYMSVPPL